MDVFLDIDEDRSRIILRFKYNRNIPAIMRSIPSAKIKLKGKAPHEDETYYYTKLNIDIATEIRKVLGDSIKSMSPELKAWARAELKEVTILRKLSNAEDAELELMPELLPELYRLIDTGESVTLLGEPKPRDAGTGLPRPYQKADIAFAAMRKNSCNFNHAGLGKTIEVIGAIAESGCLDGSHLIGCPVVSKNSVWEHEWRSWVPSSRPVLVTPEGRAPRQAMLRDALRRHERGDPFALVVNPAMIKVKSEFKKCPSHRRHKYRVHDLRACEECVENYVPEYPELFEIEWDWVVLDEVQKMGVYNMASMTYKALLKIPNKHRVLMSSTPFAGKTVNVYNILHLMDKKEFSNRMDFANKWLQVEKDTGPYASRHSTVIGELKSCPKHPGTMTEEDIDCEDCLAIRQPFWDMLATHAVRRTKKEYLTQLPDKMYVDLWVEMTPEQKKQYEAFARDAEVTIDQYKLSSVGVLAEYARLKQFAGAVQDVEIVEPATLDSPMKYKLIPTEDSPKLPQIMEILESLGIVQNEPVGGLYEQAVIFSESARMVDMVSGYLKKQGIPTATIAGNVSQAERQKLQAEFQADGGLRVLVISTQAAGVSITLDRASTAIFLDETWNPDDQEQAEDRIHRGSRFHQVTCYYIRTKGTIQEEIQDHVGYKRDVNKMLLKIRKRSDG